MTRQDCLTVAAIALVAAGLSEFVSWLLVYRTEVYETRRRQLESLTAKLETEKSRPGMKNKAKERKMEGLEAQIKEKTQEMATMKFKATIAVGVIMFGIFRLLNRMFDGVVVAVLPFEPIALVAKMSHRNLQGDDLTECSMGFMYFLCSMSFRSNLQKLLGHSPPRQSNAPSLFDPPSK